MGSVEEWADSRLIAKWDDVARTFTRWDENGVQIEQRVYTQWENEQADLREGAEALSTNERTLRDRATSALANNADYLDLVSPSNAQALAQIRSLTKQMNALIRLTVNQLADIADTE